MLHLFDAREDDRYYTRPTQNDDDVVVPDGLKAADAEFDHLDEGE
jgi:hypothetical protein